MSKDHVVVCFIYIKLAATKWTSRLLRILSFEFCILSFFLDFSELICKFCKPFYISEYKIKLLNFNGNERIKIFKEMFKNNKNITLGPALDNYKRTMCEIFGSNPQPLSSNQNDYFDRHLEFYTWHKFNRILRLLINFEMKLDKEMQDKEISLISLDLP